MKLHKIKILALVATIAGCIPAGVSAIGLSATPATLFARTSVGSEGTTRFTVSNPSTEVGLFEAYPEEFETRIVLIPSRFVLEAGEKREVLVRAKGREEGSLRTVIAIEGESLGVPSQGVGGGVRLPFLLEVTAESSLFSAVFFSGAGSIGVWFLIGALTVFFLIRGVSLSTLKRHTGKSTL